VLDRTITIASLRDDLVAWCEDAAEWRLYKAAELAGDGRNLASVDALEAAAEGIAELPDGDPRLARLERAWSRLGNEERVVAVAEQRGVVKRHGYDGAVTLEELLDQLIRVCESIRTTDTRKHGRARGISKPAGSRRGGRSVPA